MDVVKADWEREQLKPAPDTEQGEPEHKVGPITKCPRCIRIAADGRLWRTATIESAKSDDTPAADPQRDPETYPGQHRVLDELQGKMFAASQQPVFDPEPQRVTLPDEGDDPKYDAAFAWSHYRKEYGPNDTSTAHKAFMAGWQMRGDNAAEPPKADPAETDDTFEQYQRELRHTQAIEDRAAKRGRDEALAVVVKAIENRHKAIGNISRSLDRDDLLALATELLRVQKGGGGR